MLGAIDQDDAVISFIRHYWLSLYDVKRERELYEAIKKRITSRSAAVEFADDLARLAPVYQTVLSPDDAFETNYGNPARVNMTTLNLLGMVQIRPLVLAVLDKFSPEEVRKALRMFVAWSVRFVIVGGLGGGTLERHYSQRAIEVRSGKWSRSSELGMAMQGVVPRDVVFRSAFESHIEAKAKISRYYLRALEAQEAGGGKPAMIPNPDTDAVNLEHVLPQNPTSDWNLSDDIVRAYANRLGNLCLLEKKLNSRVANGPFTGKRAEYKNSSFSLTHPLALSASWGPAEIDQRQRVLAALAVRAWRL
jgi:hypothetical protein